MANLRGGTYEKQVKNAFHRLAAFGEKRYGNDDHLTHSNGLAIKREMFLNDFKTFVEKESFSAKLNQLMGNETVMNHFFEERLGKVSRSTAENYLRGFSSMITGLREKNVTISETIDKAFFDTKVKWAKEHLPKTTKDEGRAIENSQKVISDLYERNFVSGVIAEVLDTLGIRIAEAYALISNPSLYIRDGEVIGLVGKGNHIYIPKTISASLTDKITRVEKLPAENTFRRHLKMVTDGKHVPHDFRFTVANRLFHQKLSEGIPYQQATKEVSIELNHSREEMTHYYLSRA